MGSLGHYAAGDSRERSISELVRDVIADVQAIMRSEVKLARTEVAEEAGKAIAASKMTVVGAALGVFALAFFFVAVFQGLVLVMAPWLAATVIFAALAIFSLALIFAGKGRWRRFHPTPEKTVETLKENAQWARNQTKS